MASAPPGEAEKGREIKNLSKKSGNFIIFIESQGKLQKKKKSDNPKSLQFSMVCKNLI